MVSGHSCIEDHFDSPCITILAGWNLKL
jgi:hypothetical protein